MHSHRRVVKKPSDLDELWREQLRTSRPLISSKPSSVGFRIITKCLAGCVMCGYTNAGKILSLDQFKRAAEELLPTAKQVLLIGGEVLQHPDFYEICECAYQYGVDVHITTNLYKLNGRRAKAIEGFLSVVKVSADGASKRTYESIRTHLSFDRLVDNLQTLAEIRNRNPKLQLHWAFVAMRQNIEELPAAVEMAHRFGFRKMTVNFVIVHRPMALDESLLFHRDVANRCFDQARRKADDLNIALSIPQNFSLSRDPYLDPSRPTEAHKRCMRPWDRVQVLLSGNVVPCCHLRSVPMGNMFDESFELIWNGQEFQSLRNALKTSSSGMPTRCRDCQLLGKQTDSNNAMLHVGSTSLRDLQQRMQLLTEK